MNFKDNHQLESCASSNFSYLETTSTAVHVLSYTFVVLVVMLTVTGNMLVIISICHFKQLQTPTNFLLLSLAMADFLVGVTVMPLYFSILVQPQRHFSTFFCTMLNVTELFLTCISIYNVALIAVDRYFAVSNPFHYSTKMTVSVTLRLVAILWIYSLIYNMVLLYFNGNIIEMKANVTCSECIVTVNEKWSVIDFIIVFVLPCLIIIIIYLKIFVIAKKHVSKIKSVRKCRETNNSSMASEIKAAKTLGILVAIFLLCLVPYYVSVFLDVFMRIQSGLLVLSITETLVYLNSSINPIIYALLYPWFQKSVKLIITLRICSAECA